VNALLPFVGFLLVVIALLVFSARARRRQATLAAQRAATIGVGSEVMTTSGLYGTVVARNDDETAVLSIAPGVEVKWALAALRDVASLPGQFRAGGDTSEEDESPARVELNKPAGNAGEDGGTSPRS